MQRFLPLLITAVTCLHSISSLAADKYALLVGVTSYQHAQMNRTQLKYPEADAKAVGELLKSNGYEIRVLTGEAATRQSVEAELAALEKHGTAEGVVFIGLFGHGVQYGNDAYFGPYDTQVRKVTDAAGKTVYDGRKPRLEPDPQSMISMQRLLEGLMTCGAGNRVLVADCCREDPSAARGRAFGSSIKISDLEPGTAAIFSCSNSEQAFEHDDWGHGAFTRSLLDYCGSLKAGADSTANTMTVPLFRTVRSMVSEKTNGRSVQTVNPIVNGVVDLKLQGVSGEKIKAGTVRNDNSLKLDFVWCPPGEMNFEQQSGRIHLRFNGSSRPFGDTAEVHSSRLTLSKGFWIGRYEITAEQLKAVLNEESDLTLASEASDSNSASTTWTSASRFCEELTKRERNAGRIGNQQAYRLPTMAEWQWAFRSGAGTRYFFGDNLDDATQYASPMTADTPGRKRPNAWGIHDMLGHLPEWCSDWFSNRTWPQGTDPQIAEADSFVWDDEGTPVRFKAIAGYYGNTSEEDARGISFDAGTLDCPYYGIRIILSDVSLD
jgi:formylglycine-generating enzyme required for sulfatase activity